MALALVHVQFWELESQVQMKKEIHKAYMDLWVSQKSTGESQSACSVEIG